MPQEQRKVVQQGKVKGGLQGLVFRHLEEKKRKGGGDVLERKSVSVTKRRK